MSEASDDARYDIGYRKPPTRTQFKKGQSGNRQGRPKQSKSLYSALEAELNALAVITEKGKSKKLPKSNIIMKQLVNKAAAGDYRAISILLGISKCETRKGTQSPWNIDKFTPESPEERAEKDSALAFIRAKLLRPLEETPQDIPTDLENVKDKPEK